MYKHEYTRVNNVLRSNRNDTIDNIRATMRYFSERFLSIFVHGCRTWHGYDKHHDWPQRCYQLSIQDWQIIWYLDNHRVVAAWQYHLWSLTQQSCAHSTFSLSMPAEVLSSNNRERQTKRNKREREGGGGDEMKS